MVIATQSQVGDTSMLGWFAETTVVAGGLALAATLASRLRSVGPTVRHALGLVAVIKLMIPLLVSWPWATSWRVVDWPVTAPQVIPNTRGKTLVDGNRPHPIQRYIAQTSVAAAFTGSDPAVGRIEDALPDLFEARVEPEQIAAVPHHSRIACLSLPEPGRMAWSGLAGLLPAAV